MTEEPLDRLCAALEATAERPLDRRANRWLGEAQAVAEDVRDGELAPAVERDRLATVRDLLDEVDTTGDPVGDEHLHEAEVALTHLLSE